MDIANLITQLLPIISMVVIPYIAVLIKKKVDSDKDRARASEYDQIAEGMLNLVRIQHPDWSFIDHIDKFKDELVNQIMADPRSTNNPAIADRVAATAIVRAKNGG